jgi:organic hydroperoxide reductase OsmC/OhrA
MLETTEGGGHFTKVVLRPQVKVRAEDDVDLARQLHRAAHAKCFIANSVNFPIEHEPVIVREGL